ncbi:hypothetical protein PLESTB_000035900 [Pleodorina starrii]|uniref:Uncharacterized protein n=1 Tax=Pleodorina starrii TaxID=330485 RepID=A0A9W6EXD0_9CHLO|nr:hypothetical protein PLESTM_001098200 [Pleodorina starrii]GLC47881.1 hypothetical protein PLESTB_000035900 [Pleodorina starrii]GLC70688.1 hypothetical protein PLESTF_001022600 [Pleodorina starrii]
MTTDQPSAMNQLSMGLDKAQFGIKLKSPKILVGPLELGLAAHYNLSDPSGPSGENDRKEALVSIERFKPLLSVKDVFFRGKFELEPKERCLHYSKKFRVPYLHTELLKLRLTAKLPAAETSSGLLGRAFGVTVTFQPERSRLLQLPMTPSAASSTAASGASRYDLQLAPRLGPPQVVYDKIGFPGSVYFKTNATLQLTDAASIRDLRAHLDVHSVNAVIRLYDPAHVKPCRVGRNLARVARELTAEDVGSEDAPHAEVFRVAGAPQPQPDIIDKLAARSREWAHAVLVNSCVATRNLQDKAAETMEAVRAYVSNVAASSGKS